MIIIVKLVSLRIKERIMFFFLIIVGDPVSTLFPYTTLFRSWSRVSGYRPAYLDHLLYHTHQFKIGRSEEHTSELQSRFERVCRLLLDKKNNTNGCVVVLFMGCEARRLVDVVNSIHYADGTGK